MNNNLYYVCLGDACFLPVVMSVRDLREQVEVRLTNNHPEGFEAAGIFIPSDSWIAYQFNPKHSSHATSMHYTGDLNIKHKVQSRRLVFLLRYIYIFLEIFFLRNNLILFSRYFFEILFLRYIYILYEIYLSPYFEIFFLRYIFTFFEI